MRRNLSFLLLILCSNLHAEVPITPAANFGGGLNVKTVASDIEENESPDMSNMINDLYGGSLKRYGSRRFISQAISSNPITSGYRVYQSTGNSILRALMVSSGDRIYVTTTTPPSWVTIASGN